MRDLYAKVGERLGAVAFDRIYKGFSPFDFALYNSDNVYLSNTVIPYDRRFVGNTCIEYEGRWIAIWAVDQPGAEDPETLAANRCTKCSTPSSGQTAKAAIPRI